MKNELEVFLDAKRDETDARKSKTRKYFSPQTNEKNDIGKELSFMTCRNPTKFLSIIGATHRLKSNKLSCTFACMSPSFNPCALSKIAYVHDATYNFGRFAALLHIVTGYIWPLIESEKARMTFLKSLKHYRPKLNGAYIGYLLGYKVDDIVRWGHGNGSFDDTRDAVAINCEALIREAIASPFIGEVADGIENKALSVMEIFPHIW